nr:DUF3470 domain-containing protein [Rhodospirillales bacterium]
LPDTEDGLDEWLELNTRFSESWPNITTKGTSPADGEEWDGKDGKRAELSENAGTGA